MKCPNCHKGLAPEKIGSTVYWRCKSCGAFWFDNKENDFLTQDEATKLDQFRPRASFSNLNYLCPRDNKPLKFDSHYYRCFSCGGVLASSNAILAEKTTKSKQMVSDIKKPLSLGQFKYVVVFGLFMAFIGINIGLLKGLRQRVSIDTQAQQIENSIRVQKVSQNKLALYFATDEPYRSTVLLENSQNKWERVISNQVSLSHFLILDKPVVPTKIKIRLISVENEEYTTAAITLPE